MDTLQISDLWKLEDYAERRSAFRAEIMASKRNRKLHVGPHVTLLFENRQTVQYQVQEMLRIERIFERAAIQDELDAYNPLIPSGSNWKATCLVEYADPVERAQRLAELKGLENAIWVQVGECSRITPHANEDMDYTNDAKTSAVHFLRFELDADSVSAAQSGAAICFGVDHDAYRESVTAPEPVRAALVTDLG